MTTTHNVKILSTGAYLPGDPLDNATLEKYVGPLPDDVLEGIQVKTRHWMIDPATGEHRINNSRMAEHASRQALQRAGMEPADLDLIVVCTATPEYTLPNVATTLQHYLGLESAAAIEIRGACAGWVQALDLARRQLTDGTAHTALIVGSEAGSPILAPHFLGKDPARVRMRDRLTLYTFGDGAGAVVMQAQPAEAPADGSADESADGFAFVNACVGGLRKPGMEIIGGGTDVPQAEQLRRRQLIQMKVDVPGTTTFGPKVFVRAIQEMARKDGRALRDFDAIVLPEGNADYFAAEFASAGLSPQDIAALDGRIVENLADVGATGSAAVPLSLDAGWTTGRIRPGDRTVLLGIEASRYIYTGLALTWQAPPAA
jgi:3-oxoacyl-[acyl-carrier-protein] synthase-3